MDLEARKLYIQKAEQNEADRRTVHAEKLKALEDTGFDLDVATDIYGLGLLDPTPNSEAIVELWKQLYEALQENPDQPIWIIQQYDQLVDQCYGFGAQEEYDKHCFATRIEGANIASLQFTKMTESSPSEITLLATQVLQATDGDLVASENTQALLGRSLVYGDGVVHSWDASPALTGVLTFNPGKTSITSGKNIEPGTQDDWFSMRSAVFAIENTLEPTS